MSLTSFVASVYRKLLIHSRVKLPKNILPIKYIPDEVYEEAEVIDFRRKIKKREKRKRNIRKVEVELKKTAYEPKEVLDSDDDVSELSNTDDKNQRESQNEQPQEESHDQDEFFEVDSSYYQDNADKNYSSKSNLLNRRRTKNQKLRFSLLSNLNFLKITTDDSSENFQPDTKSTKRKRQSRRNSISSVNSDSESTSNVQSRVRRQSRFFSKEKMIKIERRRSSLLLRQSISGLTSAQMATHNEDDFEHDICESILDNKGKYDNNQVSIIQKRKNLRRELQAYQGDVNKIAVNAGPTPDLIPPGCKVVDAIDNLFPETLLLQRVMYLFEELSPRPGGWFIGMIISTSQTAACNYCLKFDRAITGSLFVDGMISVMLALEGTEAYGRRWVIIQSIDSSDANFIMTNSRIRSDQNTQTCNDSLVSPTASEQQSNKYQLHYSTSTRIVNSPGSNNHSPEFSRVNTAQSSEWNISEKHQGKQLTSLSRKHLISSMGSKKFAKL